MSYSSSSRSTRSLRLSAVVRLTCLLGILCLHSSAVGQYRLNAWRAEDGLPQNIVRGIAQTPDGYLWIATLDGLARFDGIRFILFDRSNTPGITKNRFTGMIVAPNGDLWLSTEGRGLIRYHNGFFRTYDVDALGMTTDHEGNIWVLQPGKITRWNEVIDGFVEIMPSRSSLPYHVLRWENAGFWRVDQNSLRCFLRGHFAIYPLPRGLKSEMIGAVAADPSDNIWVETTDGRHLHISRAGVPGLLLGAGRPTLDSLVDPTGHSWNIGIKNHLDRSIQFSSSGHATELPFSRFFLDREKNLWLGTEGQGLYQLQKQTIQVISKEQGLGSVNVYPVFQDNSDAMWIGTWGAGLSRLSAGKFKNYTAADGLPNLLLTALGQDRKGHLWVGTHGGLSVFDGKRFRSPSGPSLPENAIVQSIYQDGEGTLWFGTSSGLASYREGRTQLLTASNGLATTDVRAVIEDKHGGLWVGGYGGLTRIVHNQFSRWTEHDGLPSNTIRSLYQDGEGILWIGTYDGGLGRLKDGKFTRYTERDGLFNNGVFQILEGPNDELWISCNRGIYRVNKRELNEYADGTRHAITSVAYGKSDGMLNLECNGGTWPAGTKTRDGRLWFPTQDGVAVIDPDDIRNNMLPPPVVIESLTADRMPISFDGPVRIPPEAATLDIAYTGLSFINSGQIRFKYKLDGLDLQWVDAGSRRTAYYSHVPPGRYLFHVIAVNSDGVWNMEGQSVAFTVLSPFYRTWWFATFVMAGCSLLLWLAWHRRVSQLQHAQLLQQTFSRQLIASQENERKRIAAELHDSIGQRLVVINNLALFFLRSHRDKMQHDEANSIAEISAEAMSAIQEAREISYNLRPFQLDRLGLTNAIRGIVRSVSAASGIPISSTIDNIDDSFPEELRINFYRIVQESLNNVMKHAQATEVSIHIQRDRERVVLSVHDNGNGFMISQNFQALGKSGFGMTGMAERARLLGGEIAVQSTVGRGTTLTVTISASREKHD